MAAHILPFASPADLEEAASNPVIECFEGDETQDRFLPGCHSCGRKTANRRRICTPCMDGTRKASREPIADEHLPSPENVHRLLIGLDDDYADAPLAPRRHLTIQEEPVFADGVWWEPAIGPEPKEGEEQTGVYAERAKQGFQIKNPWDEFLESCTHYGLIAHNLENGATVQGYLVRLLATVQSEAA